MHPVSAPGKYQVVTKSAEIQKAFHEGIYPSLQQEPLHGLRLRTICVYIYMYMSMSISVDLCIYIYVDLSIYLFIFASIHLYDLRALP